MRVFRPIRDVRVVGLCGHARHGKDEAARLILRLRPGAERFAFSDALSVVCRVYYQMTVRDPTLLQDVGMWFRGRHQGVWLDAIYGAIEDRLPALAVITGVRFADEAQMVRDMGGQLIRVVRMNVDGSPYVTRDRNPNHAAEAEIDSLPHDDVWAASTLAALRVQVQAWSVGLTV